MPKPPLTLTINRLPDNPSTAQQWQVATEIHNSGETILLRPADRADQRSIVVFANAANTVSIACYDEMGCTMLAAAHDSRLPDAEVLRRDTSNTPIHPDGLSELFAATQDRARDMQRLATEWLAIAQNSAEECDIWKATAQARLDAFHQAEQEVHDLRKTADGATSRLAKGIEINNRLMAFIDALGIDAKAIANADPHEEAGIAGATALIDLYLHETDADVQQSMPNASRHERKAALAAAIKLTRQEHKA